MINPLALFDGLHQLNQHECTQIDQACAQAESQVQMRMNQYFAEIRQAVGDAVETIYIASGQLEPAQRPHTLKQLQLAGFNSLRQACQDKTTAFYSDLHQGLIPELKRLYHYGVTFDQLTAALLPIPGGRPGELGARLYQWWTKIDSKIETQPGTAHPVGMLSSALGQADLLLIFTQAPAEDQLFWDTPETLKKSYRGWASQEIDHFSHQNFDTLTQAVQAQVRLIYTHLQAEVYQALEVRRKTIDEALASLPGAAA